ncbi:MAG: Gfo/Idh/MocA family oxidoreductase [Gemmatimonadetes bacterium]|nr:Gfo/Idh/MocA family oxidoreductase [Gemmatimonadota bacterium]
MTARTDSPPALSRRDFLKTSAAATLGLSAALHASAEYAYADGGDTMRVGLIGCGGRGTGAAADVIAAAEGTEIVAMGDLFADRLEKSRAQLAEKIGARLRADADHAFTGFEAYRRVLESDLDLVILATPPAFRPVHLRAAIAAGHHVFMEKPVAVDPVGVRRVIEAADLAQQRGLAIVAGTQRRHDPKHVETMRRLHDGAIGEILAGQVYWNQGGLWHFERKPGISDVEWQIRNWLYFTWLSGDHIVEQHVHNLDVANWALRAHPVRATGVGGRQVRVDPSFGHIYDHFAVELEYPNGARVLSMCRQQDGTAGYIGEHFTGTRGTSDGKSWIRAKGEWRWQAPGEEVNPYVQEHRDLIASLRAGKPLNEGRQIAESTLTAIMAREAAYTGQVITWDEILAADLDLTPPVLAFGPLPVAPVAQPGLTRLSRPPFDHAWPAKAATQS